MRDRSPSCRRGAWGTSDVVATRRSGRVLHQRSVPRSRAGNLRLPALPCHHHKEAKALDEKLKANASVPPSPLHVMLAASMLISLAVFATAGTARTDGTGLDLGDCQKLQVPAGNKVAIYEKTIEHYYVESIINCPLGKMGDWKFNVGMIC